MLQLLDTVKVIYPTISIVFFTTVLEHFSKLCTSLYLITHSITKLFYALPINFCNPVSDTHNNSNKISILHQLSLANRCCLYTKKPEVYP